MKRIVVPTDFSECAMSALKVAAQISEKIGAVISLVHTYQLPVYGFTSGHLMYNGKEITKIRKQIEAEMQKIAKLDFIKKYKVERFLLPEYSVEDIVEQDKLKKADLIVMGTHGTSGWKEDLIGSNTERLIRKAKCPVLAVRTGDEAKFNPKEVVFASNFYGEVYERFDAIGYFADLYKSNLHLLYVNTPTDFVTTEYAENLMMTFKEKFKLKKATMHIYNDESVEDGVIHFARKTKADLIALETHGRTGVNHILKGSIAEDVANHASIPVLTFRIKDYPKPRGVIFPEMR